MKSRNLLLFASMILVALLATPFCLAAQEQTGENEPKERKNDPPRYRFIDLGTLGGPNSSSFFGDVRSVTNQGTVMGQSDTSIPDPNFPNFNPYIAPDPFIQHTFRWQNGVLTDLGALPGTNSSVVGWINDRGMAVGSSTNTSIDPLTGWPTEIAVLWSNGQILNLGTLGGNESQADAINERGQIVGIATNAVPDQFPSPLGFGLPGFGTQQRAFLWENGVMRDLGTLGGPDAVALLLNERGEVSGLSYTTSTPNSSGSPTVDPFFWEHGKMLDLGGFGGTFGSANWLNNRGQVVGFSFLTGDSTVHPFLWSEAEGMRDLGTLGGTFGIANWVNEKGEVVGVASNQSEMQLAFLWKNGVMTNLGTQDGDPCSTAVNINSRSQIVGSSNNCQSESGHAFLWQDGHMIDLSSFVPLGSGLTLDIAFFINDRGDILGVGTLPNGDIHDVLLIPCDDDHPGVEGCESADTPTKTIPKNAVAPRAQAQTTAAETDVNLTPSEIKDRVRVLLAHRRFRGWPPQ